eukprot:scaffold3815_cov832-Pavlova_lutheri.AAC.1
MAEKIARTVPLSIVVDVCTLVDGPPDAAPTACALATAASSRTTLLMTRYACVVSLCTAAAMRRSSFRAPGCAVTACGPALSVERLTTKPGSTLPRVRAVAPPAARALGAAG